MFSTQHQRHIESDGSHDNLYEGESEQYHSVSAEALCGLRISQWHNLRWSRAGASWHSYSNAGWGECLAGMPADIYGRTGTGDQSSAPRVGKFFQFLSFLGPQQQQKFVSLKTCRAKKTNFAADGTHFAPRGQYQLYKSLRGAILCASRNLAEGEGGAKSELVTRRLHDV